MQVEIKVPDGQSGDWKVETFVVSEEAARFASLRAAINTGRGGLPAGTYRKLTRNGTIIMSNTPDEINDNRMFVYNAKGHVLINGLGLGVVLEMLLKKDKVEKITIIENSEDVINLVGPTYKDNPKVNIIHADAFEYKPPKGEKYDAVWHDIWDYICGDNVEEMKKLHRKYGRRTKWQASWCRKQCEYNRGYNGYR